MFWKKKKDKKPEEELKNILVMPDDFYGGKDPVVHYIQTEKIVGDKGRELKMPQKESASAVAHTNSRLSLKWLLQRKKVLFSVLAVIFIGIVVGISWYYINQAQKATQERLASQVQVVKPVVPAEEAVTTPPVEEEESAIITEPEVVTTTPEITKTNVLEFPSIFLVDSGDLDSDSLTDQEEELLSTDSGIWDTDGDGFYDGQEVFNLYNPKGTAPMKIVDSGLVKEYINPIWQYRLYFPAQWASAGVDETADQVLLSALSGDYIEVVAREMNSGESFTDWFGREVKGQIFSDLQAITNRFKEAGLQRKDGLVAYFVDNSRVFVLVYHPGVTGDIPYRHVMQMAIQSFRPAKTNVVLPEQQVMPVVVEVDISTTTPTSTVATSTLEEIL